MIDAHCHLNASYNSETVSPVIKKFIDLSGKYIVDVTTTIPELSISQQIIAQFPKTIYGNIGIHPESPTGDNSRFKELMEDVSLLGEKLPALLNIVGIGETGLDYSHSAEFADKMPTVLEQQRELFVEHLKLAKTSQLPLVIHARGENFTDYVAYTEILQILKDEHFSLPVYFHSFCGDYELAKVIVEHGYYLGVNGIVTYSGAKNIAEIVEKIPLEFLLLETDSPFLIPSNMDRSTLENPKVNEPSGIFSTAKRMANLRKCLQEEILESASVSAKKFFAKIL